MTRQVFKTYDIHAKNMFDNFLPHPVPNNQIISDLIQVVKLNGLEKL